MGKKTKPNRFSDVKKVIACPCGTRFDAWYRVDVATMLVIEHRQRVVMKGHKFKCSGCDATHDATKDGERVPMADWGAWARI